MLSTFLPLQLWFDLNWLGFFERMLSCLPLPAHPAQVVVQMLVLLAASIIKSVWTTWT